MSNQQRRQARLAQAAAQAANLGGPFVQQANPNAQTPFPQAVPAPQPPSQYTGAPVPPFQPQMPPMPVPPAAPSTQQGVTVTRVGRQQLPPLPPPNYTPQPQAGAPAPAPAPAPAAQAQSAPVTQAQPNAHMVDPAQAADEQGEGASLTDEQRAEMEEMLGGYDQAMLFLYRPPLMREAYSDEILNKSTICHLGKGVDGFCPRNGTCGLWQPPPGEEPDPKANYCLDIAERAAREFKQRAESEFWATARDALRKHFEDDKLGLAAEPEAV